jgi:hypothetical protein
MPRGNGVEGDEVVEVGRSFRPASALPGALSARLSDQQRGVYP